MKVIGRVNNDKYICEVNHIELEKFMGLYYNNMKRLDIYEELDLGKGYDYYTDTMEALDETKKFIKANSKIIQAIMNGLTISSNRSRKWKLNYLVTKTTLEQYY